jgi:ppGpp synthetase/RelA/SpoT-type nucleotidyltranferase
MLPPSELSKNQFKRLGDRLRRADISESDLRLLDGYRRSFTDAYEDVVGRIRDQLGLEPTGRPAKSTPSIIQKLRRERTLLSRMQDIAGCRLVAADIRHQDEVVNQLRVMFEKTTVVDRRQHSSHGYRAFHVIVESRGKLIEIQVRTALQHLWAEVSEKISDVVDPAIKYGVGDKDILLILALMSDRIKQQETIESELAHQIQTQVDLQHKRPENVDKLAFEVHEMNESIIQALNAIGEIIPRLKGRKDALSD